MLIILFSVCLYRITDDIPSLHDGIVQMMAILFLMPFSLVVWRIICNRYEKKNEPKKQRKGNQEKRNVSTTSTTTTKEELLKAIFKQMAQQSPSQHFAQGSIFDIVRQQHSPFEQIVRAHDLMSVHKYFINAYRSFCNSPTVVGAINANIVNPDKNDTDPRMWNTDVFNLQGGDVAVLCFMPINDPNFEARIIGVILGRRGDGYYYCNLNKNNSINSEVMRNKAKLGIEKAGEVNGRGFELMNAF